MESDLRARAIRDAQAALRSVASALRDDFTDAGLLATQLAIYGDALRLILDAPAALRRWTERLPVEAIHAAVLALTDESSRWATPGPRRGAALDDALAAVVRRRDEMESVITAIRRICIARHIPLDDVASLGPFETALATKDRLLADVLTRRELVAMLGVRAANGTTWATSFPEASIDGASDSDSDRGVDNAWKDAGRRTASPSNEVVTRYITRGVMSRYVEGVAAANAAFAEELASSIEGLKESGETVALVPRRWMRASGRSGADAFEVPPRRAAAATAAETTRLETTEVLLGTLVPLDAEARLVVSATNITLDVYPGAMALASVTFGETTVTRAASSGEWCVVIPRPTAPVLLRVLGADGDEFSEPLTFSTE